MSLKAVHRLSIAIASSLILVSIAQGQAANVMPGAGPGPRPDAFNYGVDVGIGESDNVTLVPSDKISQTIALTEVDFDLTEQSRRLDVDAKGNFSYLDYLQNAYGGELLGRFDGTADLAVIPERLTWVLQENFGQAQIDPFQPVVPTNLENVNYVATGPDVALRLGSTVFLDLSARYARTTYETDPFDSNRMLGSADLGMPLSAQSNVSIDASFQRVLFDNTLVNTDFDRSSAYLHYDVSGARTNFLANFGATRVTQGDESITGPLGKLQLSRKLTASSTIALTLGRDLTDASTGFSNLQSGAAGGIVTAPAAVTLTNYTITYATLGWEYVRNRTTFGLSGTWEKDSYDGQPLLDVTRSSAQFRLERKLTRALTAQLLGTVYRNQYENTGYTETDGLVGAALSFRAGRGLEIKLRYDHASRVVDVAGGGYQENRAFLTIGYRPRPAEAT